MLDSWLEFSTKSPNPFSFPVIEGRERAPHDDHLVQNLGRSLFACMADPAFVEWLAAEGGVEVARGFVAAHAVPTTVTTAVGDFGEVLSGIILEDIEGLILPIKKLRYRETAAGPMRLTDTFALRLTEAEGAPIIEAVCFCSVKTATTPPSDDVAVQGYAQLEQDHKRDKPEILSFVMWSLYRENDLAMAALVGDLLARRDRSTPRVYRLSLVVDAGVWQEAFLERLDERAPDLPEFATYVVKVNCLRELIDRCYEAARRAAP